MQELLHNTAILGGTLEALPALLRHSIALLQGLSFESFLPDLRAQGAEIGGGVGNLVAAALQTKGLVDQARILSQFRETLVWIAALAWLFSISLAIGSVAVFGNYKQGLYLLVGPPLFYYMITATAQTDGTKVRVGDREVSGAIQDQNRLLRWIRAIGGNLDADGNVTGAGSADISLFFGVFDAIVTEMVQKVVSVIVDSNNRNDLRFVARERARSFVLQNIQTDSALSSLIITYHFGECGEATQAFQLEESRRTNVPVRHRPQGDIDAATQRILDTKWNKKWLTLSPEVIRYLIGMRGVQIDDAGGTFPEVPFQHENDHTPVSCKQVWEWVRGSCFFYSRVLLQPETFRRAFPDAGSDTPWGKVYEDLRRWLQGAPPGGGPSNVDPIRVLAAFIYKNAAADSTHSALQSQVFTRTPWNAKQYESVFGDLTNAEAHGGYFKLRYFATSIPYIQGLLLYLLTVSFPFFAIFLVLPGRATSFLVWCSLWVWVKSWDVGFALVFVARDIFWHFFNNRINVFEQRINWDTPANVMQVAFQNDPLMHENTYWVIVSALTVSVPVLTAHFCMGATGLFDMFKASIDQTSNRFASVEANRARRHRANQIETQMRAHAHNAAALYAAANARNPMAGDPGQNRNPYGAQTPMGDPVADLSPDRLPGGGGVNARSQLTGNSYSLGSFLVQNSNADFRKAMDLSVRATRGLEAQSRKDNAGRDPKNKLPEKIFNPYRGMVMMSDKLDDAAVKDYQKMMADMYGKDSQQYREVANLQGGQMTWNEYFEREGQRARDLSVNLAVVTRRKMFSMAQSNGRQTMNSFLTNQQEVARNARNIFDGVDMQKLPEPLGQLFSGILGGQHMYPERPGLNYDGDIFRRPAPSGSRSSGDGDDD